MDIPVFHDDQHGTSIICAAGFLNAVEITKKKLSEVKVVFNGAGAAAMSCAKIFISLGVDPKILLCATLVALLMKKEESLLININLNL